MVRSDDRLLLFKQSHGLLFSPVKGMCLCVSLEAEGFSIDPFEDARICVKGGWVSGHRAVYYFILGLLAFLVSMEQSFLGEAADSCIEDRGLYGCSMLVGGGVIGPPIVFCDGDMCYLEAAEALLPAVGVLGCRVSKVHV